MADSRTQGINNYQAFGDEADDYNNDGEAFESDTESDMSEGRALATCYPELQEYWLPRISSLLTSVPILFALRGRQ